MEEEKPPSLQVVAPALIVAHDPEPSMPAVSSRAKRYDGPRVGFHDDSILLFILVAVLTIAHLCQVIDSHFCHL